MAKFKYEFDLDGLKDEILEQVKTNIDLYGIEMDCPQCNKEISVSKTDNICPFCNTEINLDIEF